MYLVTKVIYMATVRWQKDKSTKPNYPKQVLQTLKSSGIPMSEDSWKFSVFRYFKNCLNSSLFLQQKTDILTDIADLLGWSSTDTSLNRLGKHLYIVEN